MKPRHFFAACLMIPTVLSAQGSGPSKYPDAPKGTVVEDHFGHRIADPYRWLEDPNTTETKAWVEAENKVTFGYLEQIPQRAGIQRAADEALELRTVSASRPRRRPLLLQPQRRPAEPGVLYTTTSLDGQAARAARSEHAVVGRHRRARQHGRHRRWQATWPTACPRPARDWHEWHVRDVEHRQGPARRPQVGEVQRRLVDARTARASSTAASTSRRKARSSRRQQIPEALLPQARHAAGRRTARLRAAGPAGVGLRRPTSQTTDDTCSSTVRKAPSRRTGSSTRTCRSRTRKVVDRSSTTSTPSTASSATTGTGFYLVTNTNAPRRRVIAIDLEKPERSRLEDRDSARRGRDALAATSTGRQPFRAQRTDRRPRGVEGLRPRTAVVREVDRLARHRHRSAASAAGARTGDAFTASPSFTTPATIYRYDFASGKSTVFRQPKVDFASDAITRRSRSSTRRRTAPRCRCSSRTRRA